jgi:L-threonylcarbamoyladenylate synthase
LLRAVSLPIAAPSANLFSRPSPTRAAHVLDDLNGRIDMVLDAGPTTVGVESTVVDVTADPPVVLRPGGVTLEMLRTVVPSMSAPSAPPPADHEAMRAPGLLSKHYAPRAPLTLFRGHPARAALALEAEAKTQRAGGRSVGILSPADTTAVHLYAALRQLDASGADMILALDPGDDGLARAVRDRLTRAATTVITVE